MFPVPTAAIARRQIVDLLTSYRSRPAQLVSAVSALCSTWSLPTINAATFGFLGNAAGAADVVSTAGSNVFTSASSPWSAADVGRAIHVAGAGQSGAALEAVIVTASAGTVTTDRPAATSVAAAVAVWGVVPHVESAPMVTSEGATATASSVAVPGGVSRSDSERINQYVSVRDYGAAGDGITDDTAAIQLALDYAASAKRGVYFPAGTYLVSASAGRSAWTNACYALRPGGSDLRVCGDGNASVVLLSAHEGPTDSVFPIIFLLNGITGTVSVSDIKIQSTPRVNTSHSGPMAFSGGELGGTAASGAGCHLTLERVTIEKCSFAVHGQRFISIRMRDCNVTIQGGGAYPTYFSEGINIGNASDGSESMDCLSVTGCTWTCDGTYDDHLLYALADIARVEFTGNTILAKSKNDLIKLDGLSGGLLRSFGTITIRDNRLLTTSAAVVLSGNGSAKAVDISHNSVSDGCDYFIYSEWYMESLRVEGNVARSAKRSAVQVIKNTALATNIGSACSISHNDFDGFDTTGSGSNAIKTEAHKINTYIGNRIRPGNAGAGRVLGGPTVPDCESIMAIGNIGGTGTVPPWISYPDGMGMPVFVDVGNDWSANEGVGTSAPTGGTWKRGARVWNLSPSAGGPAGWMCVSDGTPGTWKAMANLAP